MFVASGEGDGLDCLFLDLRGAGDQGHGGEEAGRNVVLENADTSAHLDNQLSEQFVLVDLNVEGVGVFLCAGHGEVRVDQTAGGSLSQRVLVIATVKNDIVAGVAFGSGETSNFTLKEHVRSAGRSENFGRERSLEIVSDVSWQQDLDEADLF